MKTFILILLTFLVASTSFAGAVTNKACSTCMTFGDRTFDTSDSDIVIATSYTGAINDASTPFVHGVSGTPAYVVPGGLAAEVLAYRVNNGSSAGTGRIGYVASAIQDATPTSPFFCSIASGAGSQSPTPATGSADHFCALTIPTGMAPIYQISAGDSHTVTWVLREFTP